MDIFGDPEKLTLVFDHNNFMGPGIDYLRVRIFVKMHGISCSKRAHETRHRVAFDRTNEKMEVIGHEAIGDELG